MDDSSVVQYTNSFNSNDLKFIHNQINKLCNIYNLVFDKIKYYIIGNNYNYNDFKKKEILIGNSGTFTIVDSLNKTYSDTLNNPGYMSLLYKTLINKVQVLMNFVAQMLYTITYKDIDEWEKSFDIILDDVVDNIDIFNTYFKENLQKLHPDIKFINKEYDENERQDLEKFISNPLMENIYTFSLKEIILYDTDTLRAILHYLTEIVKYDKNPHEMRKYVIASGYINKNVLELSINNGYIDKDDKKYVNTEFYYQYKYYVFTKRYSIYYNLIIIPFILRLHYSLKSGIDIDNKFKVSIEYARNNKLSPYVIPQLYNFNDNKKLTESQEYQKNASLYNYIIRQIYSISFYFNSFVEMLETVSIIDTKPLQENSLNMFKLYYIKDRSINIYSSIIKEFEKMTHYIDPTEIYTITDLFNFDIAKNNIIENTMVPTISFEDYESGILFLPIVSLITLLFELYNKDKKLSSESFWDSIDSHLDKIDDYYTRIFQKYKIDKTMYNNEKMLYNIEKSIIDYDYDIGDIILYERELINESLNSFKFSVTTSLIIKPKENIEKLSNFYKYVYTPFLVNMCMKPKEMKMLPISIPMTNLIK
jgi:hypothetical protein